ncbi:serine/threonine protein kinase [Capronia epimyces CBS 606.96]|uniref:Serine/threonine protein kinase n=1 Tax=Capronia epimyces CBS 606.96 TaxID=1182542 RepID=W9XP55_9EURO|nr:serine/threonine protein kinase [Capronia epimyces CBS 606.96]EXJ82322.1 serine/threonine protein kinase [Capronia epimyces CBS 606.96]
MSNLIHGSTAQITIETSHAAKTYSSNVENLTRELTVYKRLGKHPYVAELLHFQDQTLYLERGQCLRDMLRKCDITDQQKTNWIIGLALGLEYIHSKNVVHADLNAANVIICKVIPNKNCAKWIDFGGSGIDHHQALANYDEYSYQPPQPPNQRTDIFAFGCTMFEIETGVPPFYKETQGMSVDATISYVEERYTARQYPQTEHLRFHSIITGCWLGRYNSMQELREDLELNFGHEEQHVVDF